MRSAAIILILLSLVACGRNDAGAAALSIDRFHGQWVVVNYWAQWCTPCIKEIPELNRLNQDFAQVTVLGVNYDGISGKELELQQQKLGIKFASLDADPSTRLGIARPVVLPTTLILNPKGELVATLIGPQTLVSLAQATQQTLEEALN